MNMMSRAIMVIAAVMALVAGFAYPSDAFAHAQLVKAEPARRAAVAEAPELVKLWFNEEIEGAYASLSVIDSADQAVTDAKPEVAADDPKLLTLVLPPLSPGNYTVKFRVLSVDGHVVESTYDFTVKGN